ncbi:MAG TPA: ATP-dependent helicase C-terminal domain-containing protein, partial [Polyangiales bacterium]|nr:ATP-dependent helicase C-terminal domain-containing protein [Polyangiales bacterium]
AGERADASSLRAYDLDPGAVSGVLRVRDRLERMLDAADDYSRTEAQRDEALQIATLAAFCDRVGKRRAPKSPDIVLAAGGSATLAPSSVVREAEYVVIVDASEKRGTSRGVTAHLASAIEPEWLLELFPERVEERTELTWNPKTERVEGMLTLSYMGLVLDRAPREELDPVAVSKLLYETALARGVEQFVDLGTVNALRERLAFASSIDSTLAALPEDALQRALAAACEGRRSFSELREVSLVDYLYAQLPGNARSRIAALTPDHVDLPHGRRLEVHYERGKPPWVQSRLQDFFGMKDGPRIGGKPVVLHLLAPNQRAVQVTSDLAGFWQRAYPEVRRELSRRYPRHSWPDDPLHAQPTPPKPRRS